MAAGTKRIPLDTSDDNNYEDDDDEGPVEPGKMRVSEIKAELDLREVSYADCFDKDSLAERLATARASGQADPTILNQFNKQNLEQQFSSSSSSGSSTSKINLSDQEIEAAAANDGTLPGGLTPEMFKKLTGNPDIMMLLQSTKMQEAMKLMMTGGQSELEQKLKEDPELQTTVQRLDEIMKSFR